MAATRNWYIAFLLFTCVNVLLGCGDDDLKRVATISSKKVELNKDRTVDMVVVYSDSAVVKAKLFAPIYDKVSTVEGSKYNEMPSGVKIEFYDALMLITGTITSEYAINDESKQTTIFRKNVVVVKGDMTFTTEELTWDERQKRYYSPSGTVRTADGNVLTGASFTAPQDFSSYEISSGSGQGFVKGDFNP